MSQSHRERSQQEEARTAGWFDCVDPSRPAACNVLTGIVTSRTEGLTRSTLRIRVGDRTDIRVRWSGYSHGHDAIDIGQTVRLVVPEQAVQLEAGGFRRGKQRWNRWIGRVVLVDRTHDDSVTTVKIHRDGITLRSRGPMIGARAPLATWDTVNIVVDPQQVRLTPMNQPCPTVTAPESFPLAGPQATAVWLRAIIRSFRSTSVGQHIVLDVGGATLSALLGTDEADSPVWTVGTLVEITISHTDAWLRHDRESPLLPCCLVLSMESVDPVLSVPVR